MNIHAESDASLQSIQRNGAGEDWQLNAVKKLIFKAIALATVATLLLPIIFVVVLSVVSDDMSLAQGAAFVIHKGGSLGGILLVLNMVVVFLGLSVPEIIMNQKRKHRSTFTSC